MNKFRTLAAVAAMTLGAAAQAQTPWMHVYFSDGETHITAPFSSVKSTEFTPSGNSFSEIVIETEDDTFWGDLNYFNRISIGAQVPQLHFTTDPKILDIKDKTTLYDATLTMDGVGLYPDIENELCFFRGRGNSTLNKPKKAYNFKFEEKTKVAGLRKAKSWVLLANYIDQSFMRNPAAFLAAQFAGVDYADSARPVDVFLNGTYKGTYTLCHKVGFNNGSVDLPADQEAQSIMLELDTCDPTEGFMPEHSGFTKHYRIPYQVKDPDAPEDAAEAQNWWYEWASDFEELENAAHERDFTRLKELVDYTALAKYLLVYNLAVNQEPNHPKSVFLWKTKGGKWQFGPIWDFDWAFGYQPTYYNYDKGEDNAAEKKLYDELMAYCKENNIQNFEDFEYNGKKYQLIFDYIFRYDTYEYWNPYDDWGKAKLPTYQSPLLGTGSNTNYKSYRDPMTGETIYYGHGGEFFLDMIQGNDEFMAEYAKVWAEFEAKLTEYWAAYDAYVTELTPSAAREVTAGWKKETFGEFDTTPMTTKDLKTWIKSRITYIKKASNNYGLY